MPIRVVGLSHRSAPLDVRERLVLAVSDPLASNRRIAEATGATEAMLVATCNRVEAYLVGGGDGEPAGIHAAASDHLAELAGGRDLSRYLYGKEGSDAVRHLFRVASSLDSMVVGEPQILGQVKEAFRRAKEAGTVGAVLKRAVPRSFRVAKRVRTETAIAAGSVSVSSVAVDLAERIFGELRGRPVLLVGAGTMAEDAAARLVAAGGRLLVTNRSPARAEEVARHFHAETRSWDPIEKALLEADVVLCSTSSCEPVIGRIVMDRVRRARRRPIFLVDIAVPRDVEPEVHDLPDVFLFNIDDLEQVAADHGRERSREAEVAEAIVAEELHAYDREMTTLGVVPMIAALRSRLDEIVKEQWRRTESRLADLGPEQRAALQAMLDATAKKFLHAPIHALRKHAGSKTGDDLVTTLEVAFDLDLRSTNGGNGSGSDGEGGGS